MRSLLLLLLIPLTGCAAAVTETTVTKFFDAAGNVVSESVSTIADASVKKEQAVHETLKKYLEIIPQTGMRMGWQAVNRTHFYAGMTEPVITTEFMPTFSYVDPSSIQKLPTEPSVHPGYKMAENVLLGAAKYGLIGYGLYELGGVLEAGYDAAGSTFEGDANLENSFNAAGRDQTITPTTTTTTTEITAKPEATTIVESANVDIGQE